MIKMQNNEVSVHDIVIPAANVIPEIAVVCSVRTSMVKDENGNPTSTPDYHMLSCVNPENYQSFKVKVINRNIPFDAETIENSLEPIYVKFDTDRITIVPYEINFGRVKLSIRTDTIELWKGGDSV